MKGSLVALGALAGLAILAAGFFWFNFYAIHVRYRLTVEVQDGQLVVDGKPLRVLAERDPAALPWGDLGADVVLESTGFFANELLSPSLTAAPSETPIVPSKPIRTRSDSASAISIGHGRSLTRPATCAAR